MTIIVYRDGIMAADTLTTQGGSRVAHTQKIFREDGWLIGGAGCLGVSTCGVNWVKAGADLETPVDFGKMSDSSLMLVSSDGELYYASSDTGFLVKESAPYMTAGSGSDIARGALLMGATAKQAVEIAMRIDLGCGGRCVFTSLAGQEDLELPKEIYNFVNTT